MVAQALVCFTAPEPQGAQAAAAAAAVVIRVVLIVVVLVIVVLVIVMMVIMVLVVVMLVIGMVVVVLIIMVLVVVTVVIVTKEGAADPVRCFACVMRRLVASFFFFSIPAQRVKVSSTRRLICCHGL